MFDEPTLLDRWWPVPVSLQLKITPNAKQSAFAEWIVDVNGDPVLKIKLAAPPVDGKANKALVAFLAKSLGCSKSEVVIKHGEKSRSKVVEFSFCNDERDLRDRIDSMLDG